MILDKKLVELKTERLCLRILSEDDVTQVYVDWLNDVDINQFLETRFVNQTLKSCSEFVRQCYLSDEAYLFGVFIRDEGGLIHIGNIKLGLINRIHLTGDVSYFIGEKKYWGKGLATEMIATVVDFGFKQLGLKKICAGVYEKNLGSLKVLRKCRFSIEGFLESQVEGVDGRQGVFKLGILND